MRARRKEQSTSAHKPLPRVQLGLLQFRSKRALQREGGPRGKDGETLLARAVLSALAYWSARALRAEDAAMRPEWRGDGLWLGGLMVGRVTRGAGTRLWWYMTDRHRAAGPGMKKSEARERCMSAVMDMLKEVPAP